MATGIFNGWLNHEDRVLTAERVALAQVGSPTQDQTDRALLLDKYISAVSLYLRGKVSEDVIATMHTEFVATGLYEYLSTPRRYYLKTVGAGGIKGGGVATNSVT